MNLSEIKMGESKTIVKICASKLTKFRLSSVGLNRGDEISLKGFAPLGDPMVIKVKDFVLAIRKSDAKCIEVE